MTIVPAIDIIDGKCVRLSKGDYDSAKTYSDSPLDMALRFQDAGLNAVLYKKGVNVLSECYGSSPVVH